MRCNLICLMMSDMSIMRLLQLSVSPSVGMARYISHVNGINNAF